MDIEDANILMYKGVSALARAERQGIRIDMDQAERNYKKLAKLIDELYDGFSQTKFCRHWEKSRGRAKLNIDSPYQLEHFLYKVKKIKPIKLTDSGKKGSTDNEALEALRIPELDMLLRIRKLRKLKNTYLNAFLFRHHKYINLIFIKSHRSTFDPMSFGMRF